MQRETALFRTCTQTRSRQETEHKAAQLKNNRVAAPCKRSWSYWLALNPVALTATAHLAAPSSIDFAKSAPTWPIIS